MANIITYISNGDFGFPFDFITFFDKQFYIWSYQLGAPNLDGIIRMPWRILNVIVFALFGNLAAAYFYLILSVVITAASFWIFLKVFFPKNSNKVNILVLLLFVFNPAFLGNVSKVGLVVAAALLPLCLVMLRKYFDTRNGLYMLVFFLVLNYSLLHPFTFIVNAAVSGLYLLFLLWERRQQLRQMLPRLVAWLGCGLLLNAYIILSVVSVGSIDKAVESQDIGAAPVNYTDLLGVATTKSLLTALTLSKDVFKDYNFYSSPLTQLVFTIGALGVVAVTIVLLIIGLPRLNRRRRIFVLVPFLAGLFLLFLTTGHSIAGTINNTLVSLPGGWAFRSPLKWQLYAPFFLLLPIPVLFRFVRERKYQLIITSVLGLFLVAQSFYILGDIYTRLLVPKQVAGFAQLDSTLKPGQRVLYVAGQSCASYSFNHTPVLSELNQILNSQQLQVKHVKQSNLGTIALTGFDYVLTCAQDPNDSVLASSAVKPVQAYEDGAFRLYTTAQPEPKVSAVSNMFTTTETQGISDKTGFAAASLGQPFNFVDRPLPIGATQMSEPFSDITPADVTASGLSVKKRFGDNEALRLYAQGEQPYFYNVAANTISVSSQPGPGYVRYTAAKPASVTADNHGFVTVNYADPSAEFTNQIQNGSFETGLWQKKVEDCFESSEGAKIGMTLDDKTGAAVGTSSLALRAANHIACTHESGVRVRGGDDALFSLAYKSTDAKVAGYSILFNDAHNTTVSGSISIGSTRWSTFSRLVSVPVGATQASVFLYGYPNPYKIGTATTNYDNLSLTDVPPITSSFFLVGAPTALVKAPDVSLVSANPTKRTMAIHQAAGAFLIKIKDTYNPSWAATIMPAAGSGKPVSLPEADHYRLNGIDDGWYIDTAKLCAQPGLCAKNSDGSYNLKLVAEFRPQHWFVIGSGLSGLALLGSIGFVGYRGWRRRRKGSDRSDDHRTGSAPKRRRLVRL